MFTFTSLQGAQSNSSASQSILELDGGVKVLVDVGWDEKFDTRQLLEVERHSSTLSFILLTHSTFSHLGAFAHCCKHIPIFTQIPVYATNPVIAFGRTLLQDVYSSTPLASTFVPSTASPADTSVTPSNDVGRSNILLPPPTSEEIAKYFSMINPLKYSQPHQPTASQFSPPLEGLTLTAYNSGHTLGGTIWHIQHGMESIVYAVDWNQARENVIGGAAWFGGIGGSEVIEQLRKPTALVCSSRGGDSVAPPGGRKRRDELLLDNIRSSLAKNGTVLIPSDSSARVLELAWILDKAWQEGTNDPILRNSRLYMASRSGIATMRHARSLLEWMDDSIVREFEGEDDSTTKPQQGGGHKQTNGLSTKALRPFEFRHIKMIERESQLEKALKGDGPRVILASDLTMEWGYSKQALKDVAQKAENLVILTQNTKPASTAHSDATSSISEKLWQWFDDKQDGVALEKGLGGEQLEQVHSGGRTLTIRDIQKAPLDSQEARIYQQYMATQRQLQSSLTSRDETGATGAEDAVDDDSSSSSSDGSEDEHQGRVLNVSAALGHTGRSKVALSDQDLGVSILLRKKGVYDFDVRNKRGRNAVYPYTHNRKRGDEFGEYIRPEDYLRAEEKEDQDARSEMKSSNMVGQKRAWASLGQGKNEGPQKRQQQRNGDNANDKADGVNGATENSVSDPADDSEAEPTADPFDGPAKAVFIASAITFHARLAFVDFAGIHDQRSLEMLIPLISPRKLILTGGSKEETEPLAVHCKTLLAVKDNAQDSGSAVEIFSPMLNQTVDASVDTNAWIVKLSRGLAKRLHWQNVRNMGVVTLTGQLKGEEPASEELSLAVRNKKQRMLKKDTKEDTTSTPTTDLHADVRPLLDIVPASMAAATRSVAQPLHVGDLRLADLRRLMSAGGHVAEFRGEGTLLIDGVIAVRKLGTGKIIVEGAPINAAAVTSNPHADSFYQVKRKIYEGLAVVAGG